MSSIKTFESLSGHISEVYTLSGELSCNGSLSGKLSIGEFIGDDYDQINRILTAGLTDGYKHFSDDGTIISTEDSEGRTLVKTFSPDFLTCTTVLKDQNGIELGRTVKSFSDDSCTIITTDSKGQRLVKSFSDNMRNMVAVLTDAFGNELARLTKTFSEDGKDITSTVTYGE